MAWQEELRVRTQESGNGDVCRAILATLPSWFGIPASVEDYVAVSDAARTIVASRGDQDVGFLTLVSHGTFAAEIYVMGVVPHEHRRGIGRALLAETERQLASSGVEFLQVKTLSSRKPDDGYDRTRAFLPCAMTSTTPGAGQEFSVATSVECREPRWDRKRMVNALRESMQSDCDPTDESMSALRMASA